MSTEDDLGVTSACPQCGDVATRTPYDIGSGRELACGSCEWCWGADGQRLLALPIPVMHCGQCWQCRERAGMSLNLFILCPVCGNKRCPKANNHHFECSGSNEPGQPGSAYEDGSGAATVRRFEQL